MDTDNTGARDQWATVVSDAGADSGGVVSANVLGIDARTLRDVVTQATAGVGHGCLGHPLHSVGVVAGVLWIKKNIYNL